MTVYHGFGFGGDHVIRSTATDRRSNASPI
jgi:hypothetical protein